MNDGSVSTSERQTAHLSTPQWQSFEMRMRGRKAERCLQRAEAAIGSGDVVGAQAALDEARHLSPYAPALLELTHRLESLQVREEEVWDEQDREEPRASRAWVRGLAVASLGLIVGALVGWQTWTRWPALTSAVSNIHMQSGSPVPADVPPKSSAATPDISGLVPESAGAPATAPPPSDVRIEEPVAVPPTVTPVQAKSEAPPSEPKPVAALGTAGTSASSISSRVKENDIPVASAPTTTDSRRNEARASEPDVPRIQLSEPAAIERTATERVAPPPPVTMPSAPAASTPVPSTAFANGRSENPVPSPPATATAPPAAPAPASVSARDESAAIRATLKRYESAYSDLDVDAVRAVWPTLDQRALTHAFDNLSAQRISLENCAIDVNGSSALATCSGRAAWTPRVGGGAQTASRKWTFNLTESSGGWRIVRVQAR